MINNNDIFDTNLIEKIKVQGLSEDIKMVADFLQKHENEIIKLNDFGNKHFLLFQETLNSLAKDFQQVKKLKKNLSDLIFYFKLSSGILFSLVLFLYIKVFIF